MTTLQQQTPQQATVQNTPDPLAQMRAEHVMISTNDYQGTLDWYQSILGFSIMQQWTVPEFPGTQLAYLEKNGFIIEVVFTQDSFQKKRIPEDLGTALGDRGFGHLAFLVADVDAVAEALESKNIPLIVPPTSFPDAGRRLVFIKDNNGNFLEFLTPLSAYV